LANHFRPFSTDEREKILEWAWLYLESSSAAAKRKIYRVAAETLGRSPESVKKAIRIARRELEGREPRRVK
jgi:cell division protein FtsL